MKVYIILIVCHTCKQTTCVFMSLCVYIGLSRFKSVLSVKFRKDYVTHKCSVQCISASLQSNSTLQSMKVQIVNVGSSSVCTVAYNSCNLSDTELQQIHI